MRAPNKRSRDWDLTYGNLAWVMHYLKGVLANCRDTPGAHLINRPADYTENDPILNHDIKELSKKP